MAGGAKTKMFLTDGPEDGVKEDIVPTDPSKYPSFEDIGGLGDHIAQLREWIIIPMLYADVLSEYKVRPVRGILFHGLPGTGKTLLAGALAHECSKLRNGHVAFFHRKAADILVKWVGESEQKLRDLFAMAEQRKPSIIFFDELDGLAPVRSNYQDHIHASIVTTLLTLMDGLDRSRGVIVIGATNRLDAIDPALRRSGRFDHELYFPLPNKVQRLQIIQVYMKAWGDRNQCSPDLVQYLSDMTDGYSSADLEALCSQAVMCSLNRTYPDVLSMAATKRSASQSSFAHRAKKSKSRMSIGDSDLLSALMKTSTYRQSLNNGTVRRLPPHVRPLLKRQLNKILDTIGRRWPHFLPLDDAPVKVQLQDRRLCGRLLLCGSSLQGHNTYVAPAILHAFEHLRSHIIDLQAVFERSSHAAEEVCIEKLKRAKQNVPAIFVIFRIDQIWKTLHESAKAVLVSILEDLPTGLPLLLVATTTDPLPSELCVFFNELDGIVVMMENPTLKERTEFFKPLLEKAIAFVKTAVEVKSDFEEPVAKRTRQNCKNRKNLDNAPTSHIITSGKFDESFASVPTKKLFAHKFARRSKRSKSRSKRKLHDNNYSIDGPNRDRICRMKALFRRITTYTTRNLQLTQLELFYDVLNSIISRATNCEKLVLEIDDILVGFENMTFSNNFPIKHNVQ